MPTYAYRCTECGTAFDIQQSFQDEALTECPSCGGRLRHGPDALHGISWHHAERAPALERRELDLEHPGELRLVRPDLGHGGTRVASDHAVSLEAAPEGRSVTELVQCRHTFVTHCCLFRR